MSDKKSDIKNSLKIKSQTNSSEPHEFYKFIDEKIQYIQEIIRNTNLSIKKNKENEIFSNNDTNLSISVLTELYEKTTTILAQLSINTSKSNDKIIDVLGNNFRLF
jgi:hypothetical protein